MTERLQPDSYRTTPTSQVKVGSTESDDLCMTAEKIDPAAPVFRRAAHPEET